MPFRSPHPDVVIPETTLTNLVLGRAHEYPQRAALVDGLSGRSLSFGDLRDQVRRVAAGLSRSVTKGDVVAICAPNCPEFAVVFHAVLTLGAALTPINPAYTAGEIAFQLRDANAALVITVDALVTRVAEAIEAIGRPLRIVTIDDSPGLPTLDSIAIDADLEPVPIDLRNDIAVLPYSSGTTGLAKGVMLTHRNLVANLVQIDALETHAVSTFVGVLPFFHIYGMTVIMNAGLLRGITIVTLPRFELESFLNVLQDWPIALAHVVPPIAVLLAKHPLVDAYDLSGVKWLFSGAAPFGPELTQAIRERLNVATRQGYGMTETSPVAYYTPPDAERDGTVGVLAPNTECRIVDPERGHDVQPGTCGEVWLRGPQIMIGYLNNPAATAATLDGEGWLRTGDIGMVDDDGYLTVVDRLKELIKVKGYQVAPAELEALLLEHPQIADVAVIPVADDDAGEVPKAVVVARGVLSASEVIAFVHPRVAHYKRVRFVEFVDVIPKSPSGKILRRILVARERSRQPCFEIRSNVLPS